MSIRKVVPLIDGSVYEIPEIKGVYGDTIEIVIKKKDRAGIQQTLDNETLKVWISYSYNADRLLELTETSGITVTGSSAVIEIDAADLPAAGAYQYQIWHTDYVIAYGTINLSEKIGE